MQTSTVTVIGNLTRDPQFRILKDGMSSVGTGVAVNRRWTTKDGSQAESTAFYNVVGWGPMSRNVGLSLRKGDRVVVIGRLEPREWVDAEGEKHTSIEIVADEIAPSLRFSCASVERRKPKPAEGPDAHDAVNDEAPADPVQEVDEFELPEDESVAGPAFAAAGATR